MRSRSRHLVLLAAVGLALLGGCADDSGEASSQSAKSLTGVISSIDPPEGTPESFELVRPAEDAQRIAIDPEADYGMDLQHLHEHMDGALPVKVGLEERDGTLYATSIEDV